jgi:hypothetical protein
VLRSAIDNQRKTEKRHEPIHTLLSAAVMAAVSTGVFAQDAQTALAKIQAANTIVIGHRETSVPFPMSMPTMRSSVSRKISATGSLTR